MMSRTLGAPLGGTTVGGQYGLESLASRLITPPNVGGEGGRYFPSIVVVALGEPGVPVICCARAVTAISGNSMSAASNPRGTTRLGIWDRFMGALRRADTRRRRPILSHSAGGIDTVHKGKLLGGAFGFCGR